MKVVCSKCGETIEIPSGHPRRLDIPVITLCDAISKGGSVVAAANKLGCSRAYIYQELEKVGKRPKDYVK